MPFSLASIVREFGDRSPNAPALTFEGATLSFGDLDLRSSKVANALTGLGVIHGDRVAILAKNQPEFYGL